MKNQLTPALICSTYEFGSKSNAGGLKERRVTNKAVKIFTNYENKDQCVTSLYLCCCNYMSNCNHYNSITDVIIAIVTLAINNWHT